MKVNVKAIQSAAANPQEEASLRYEELAVLGNCVLLSEPNGYFVDKDGYVKWSYSGLVQYLFRDLYLRGLMYGVDKSRLIIDASQQAGFHVTDRRNAWLVQLTPPAEAEILIHRKDIFRSRHADLLAQLRKTPLLAVFPTFKQPVPASISEIVRLCLHLSPNERQIAKWMVEEFDSPIMELMTQFGYMAEGRRKTITNLIPYPERLAALRGDKTCRKFVQRYFSLDISDQERTMLIAIGNSDTLSNLGRRIVRLSRDRRTMLARTF